VEQSEITTAKGEEMQDYQEVNTEQVEKEPEVSKIKHWTYRQYFIQNVETGDIWRDQITDEKTCRNIIRVEGEYDTEYRIGYRVYQTNTITKTAKIILK
jgi:hypothetical protein